MHCTATAEWGVNPVGKWCHTMAPTLGTTNLVGAQQEHMGQYSCFVSMQCTNTKKSGIMPICKSWHHTTAPMLGNTKLVGIQQDHTTMGQSVWPMNVHCASMNEWGVNPMVSWCHQWVASKVSTTSEMDAQPKISYSIFLAPQLCNTQLRENEEPNAQ